MGSLFFVPGNQKNMLKNIRDDEAYLHKVTAEGREKARESASKTLKEVRYIMEKRLLINRLDTNQ